MDPSHPTSDPLRTPRNGVSPSPSTPSLSPSPSAIPRPRTRSVDAGAPGGAGIVRPRPVPAQRRTGNAVAAGSPGVGVTSVRCTLVNEDAREVIRYDHSVFPGASPGAPQQHRSQVTVPVWVSGPAQPAPPQLRLQQQPSLIEIDDPLQIFDSTRPMISHGHGHGGFASNSMGVPLSSQPLGLNLGQGQGQNLRTSPQPPPRRLSHAGDGDKTYIQALIMHQKSRKDAVEKRLKLDQDRLMALKMERKRIEDAISKKQQECQDKGDQFPTLKDVKEISDANHRLRIQCDLKNRQIEFLQSYRPNGVSPEEGFYRAMERSGNTGQGGRRPVGAAVLLPQFSRTAPGQVAPGTRPIPPPPSLPAPRAPNEEEDDGPQWSCSQCTFLNHPALSTCEVCGAQVPGAGAAGAGAPPDSPSSGVGPSLPSSSDPGHPAGEVRAG